MTNSYDLEHYKIVGHIAGKSETIVWCTYTWSGRSEYRHLAASVLGVAPG
jgi:hypothetical protein